MTNAERGARWAAAVTAALLLAVLCLAAFQFWRLEASLTRQSVLVNASYAQADRLLQLVNEETGVRGYIATGDATFLDVYYASGPRWREDSTAVARAADALANLRSLATQSAQAAAAVHAVFEREIALMRAGSRARARMSLQTGKVLFDRLRRVDGQTAQALNADLQEQRAHTRLLAKAGFIVSITLCGVLTVWWIAFALVLRGAKVDRLALLRDHLTGVANRRGALETIESFISQSSRQPFGIIFIDLDGFKKINDSYGHAAGDVILQTAATRLASELRAGDKACRMGGDEFVCIIAPPATIEQVRSIARRLRKTIGQPYEAGNDVYAVGCSVGVSMYPRHGESAALLLASADRAMYGAKIAGGGIREAANAV